jgi:SpoVK/Ycf46/Vps4 family AAA+-type ATPase
MRSGSSATACNRLGKICEDGGNRVMDQADHETSTGAASERKVPLSKRIPPRLSWDDLVFADEIKNHLYEIVERWRNRHAVLDEWGFRRRLKSEGLIALFAGEPGTGKTEAASIIAQSLDLALYQVHTPGLLSKYVGETEKNIDAVMSIADAMTSKIAIVFDEAEALFAKRVEAKGSGEIAHNSQIGLLLSRLEQFNGLAFLTTNNPAMIDPAFKRRFHIFIEFELPTAEERAQILRLALADAPLADDIDFDVLHRDELSGGHIQNVAVAAAFLARLKKSAVVTNDLLREALTREGHKMGKLIRG